MTVMRIRSPFHLKCFVGYYNHYHDDYYYDDCSSDDDDWSGSCADCEAAWWHCEKCIRFFCVMNHPVDNY